MTRGTPGDKVVSQLDSRTRALSKKNSQFENLNDANIISMPMFATCKGKMERIVLFMRNGESAFLYWRLVHSKVL